ncbi:MAG: hypothetical protein ACHQWU_04980 [Gemmatimonadales bacterium]
MTWPNRSAPSANNFRDHFPGATLDATKWGTIVSGTGAVTVTDSYAKLATGGLSSAAALYYTTKLDKTKSQLWMAAVSYPTGGVAGFAPYCMALVNGASAPVADTKSNWDAKIVARRQYASQSSLAIVDQYFDTGGTQHFWDGQGASAWTTTFSGSLASQMPVRDDDYYICGLEIDGPNQRFRFIGWGQSFPTPGTWTANQGWRLFSLTDWVPWSSVRDSSNLWLVFGTPFNNDPSSAHEARVEWVRYSEAISNTYIDAWTAASSSGTPTRIRHSRSVDGEIFIPEDRTSWAIDIGTTGSVDELQVQEPCGVYDGVSTDYLFYTGVTPSIVQSICVATAAHTSPQNGPWTKFGSNPIVVRGSSGATDDLAVGFCAVIMDESETDPTKRWKMLYAGKKTSDGKWRTHLATASSPTGTWTKQGVVLDVGGAGANDEIAARDVTLVKDDSGTWYAFYEAWDASGVTHLMYATGPSLSSLTKQGTYFSTPLTATDQALTADISTAPGRTVTVASTTGFAVDETVVFSHSTTPATSSTSKVRKIVSGTQLELLHGITGEVASYPSRIKGMDSSANLTPRAVVKVGSEWWFYINLWEPFTHQSYSASYGAIIEDGSLYKHAALTPVGAQPVIDYLASPTISRGFNSDAGSNENMTLLNVPVPAPPPPFSPGIHLVRHEAQRRASTAAKKRVAARHVVFIAANVPIQGATATVTLPLALGLNATATAHPHASVTLPLALGLAAQAIAKAQATAPLPLSLGIACAARAKVHATATLVLALGLNGTAVGGPTASSIATAVLPLTLTLQATAFARVKASAVLPLVLGMNGTAVVAPKGIPARSNTFVTMKDDATFVQLTSH